MKSVKGALFLWCPYQPKAGGRKTRGHPHNVTASRAGETQSGTHRLLLPAAGFPAATRNSSGFGSCLWTSTAPFQTAVFQDVSVHFHAWEGNRKHNPHLAVGSLGNVCSTEVCYPEQPVRCASPSGRAQPRLHGKLHSDTPAGSKVGVFVPSDSYTRYGSCNKNSQPGPRLFHLPLPFHMTS